MPLINPPTSARDGSVQLGFKTSIIALFVAIVLVIGLTLVYLSFSRITLITDSAASKFIAEVAELSADRIGSQLKLVQDNLAVLNALPPIQSAEIEDNPGLNALLAAMLKNNDQLFNLYVGYDDGSFIEMDAIEGSRRETRARPEAPEQAAFRLVVISRSDPWTGPTGRPQLICPTGCFAILLSSPVRKNKSLRDLVETALLIRASRPD